MQDITITIVEKIEFTHNGLTYGTVISPYTGKVWLDRNLGAAQICTSYDDEECYGDYYQWGREADGHEKPDHTTTYTQATTITAADASFIHYNDYPQDWTTADSDGALRAAEWSKTDGTSICPVEYRVPTIDEIEVETTSALIAVTNKVDAFDNFLKLPSSGIGGSSVFSQTYTGRIWSSSVDDFYSHVFLYDSTESGTSPNYRSTSYPVRCIKD